MLASPRACMMAALAARRDRPDLIISHGPDVSFFMALWMLLLGLGIPHVVYYFNFPTLPPKGLRRWCMAKMFARLSRIVVSSEAERQIYAECFSLDLDRIEFQPWSVETPKVSSNTPLVKGDYICAVGSMSRDYRTVLEAARMLDRIPVVLVCRPENVAGLDIPPNVTVYSYIPFGDAMNILKFSRLMVIPLAGSEVPCGHVTLVAAMHLGKAFIITNSSGVADYAVDDANCVTVDAFDAEKLADAIRRTLE